MAHHHDVFLARFTLAVQDPDTPAPRYHTGIFVKTAEHGGGVFHQVTGDITSVDGMQYTPTHEPAPEMSESFHSVEKIGVTPVEKYPHEWGRVLRGVSPPPQQKAFNVKTMRTEPFKTRDPLAFYGPGEMRKSLVKCTEWTLERAIPALRREGLLIDG